MYQSFFYGNQKDSSLLVGAPQSVRSDEWLVNTELTIAQAQNGFPRVNPSIVGGRDMSLNIDVPYLDWSVFLKPQNLAFFVLPLEFAFAFKWWLLLYLLLLGAYFFTLRLFPGKRLLASILALAFSLSPFVFWWYQTTTIAPLFYGFFILILAMRIINGEPAKLLHKTFSQKTSYVLYALLLAYLLSCFALVLYPPFQIPIGIVMLFFLLGYTAQAYFVDKRFASPTRLLRPLGVLVAGGALALILCGAFITSRSGAIESITNTVYPGQRVVASGGFPVDQMMATFLQPQLERGSHGPYYYYNQSESANFMLLLPYLLIPGVILLIYEIWKYKRVDWVFVGLHICIALFFANLFLFSSGQGLYHLFQLEKVPHARMIIGLGFLGFIYTLYVMKKLMLVTTTRRKLTLLAALYALGCLYVALLAGKYTQEHFPAFVADWRLIVIAAVFFCGTIYMLLIKRFVIAAGMMLFFSLLSIGHIHPLYRGLGPVAHNSVIDTMQQVSRPEDNWGVVDQLLLENFPIMAGRGSVSGTHFYPDLDFWRQVEGKKSDDIYNRYAHVLYTSKTNAPALELQQADAFTVRLDCSDFNRKNLDFVLSTKALNLPCATEVTRLPYPTQTFFFYRMN